MIAGAGQRGRFVYGAWAAAHPDQMQVVGVVDPDVHRREAVVVRHSGSVGVDTLERALEDLPAAEAVIIATPDAEHESLALAAIGAGMHVLIEKPVAHTIEGVRSIAGAADRSNQVVAVAHVLRYTPFFQALHGVVAGGELGDLVTVAHRENVAAWHMAHSFVRGNWAKAAASAPMIVAKCCHDFDILTWNLDSPVTSLTSAGSLFEFKPDRAPAGATGRCIDPCPVTGCPYDARRLYLNERLRGWPVHVITDDLSTEGRLAALRSGPYGRCVYTAGSDVVDHQVVSMKLASGATATLTMHGHSHEEQRTMRYDGTRATLRGVFGAHAEIEVIEHATGRSRSVPIDSAPGGHGGGDHGLLAAFVEAVRTGAGHVTHPSESLMAYELAFLAEEARVSGTRRPVRESSA